MGKLAAQKLALTWVLAQGEEILPIPGTKKRKYLEDNAGALEVTVTPAYSVAIEAVLSKYPNTGNRYNKDALKFVNQ